MNNFNATQEKSKEETTSIWLLSVLKFGCELDVFRPLKAFRLKLKEVKYSIYQKLIVTMMSIMVGCETTKDMNLKLKEETLSLNMFDMERLPDQSQINTMLRRFDEESISQFKSIHSEIFLANSMSINSYGDIVVDIDQTGLIANGKTFELAEKGYFSKKKNQKGYQVLAAFNGAYSETVGMYLDSGSSHCTHRYSAILDDIFEKYKSKLEAGELIIRTDSGFGSSEYIEMLQRIPKLKFITKGYSTVTAKRLAEKVSLSDYKKVAEAAWVYELESSTNVRKILVQVLCKSGKLKYSLLLTNIKAEDMSVEELFHFYNERQTIEAFFKMAKNTYNIKNLRTRKFHGIYGFLWLIFITHNLISLFRTISLNNSEYQDIGVSQIIKESGVISGTVVRSDMGITVNIPPINQLAKILFEAITNNRYYQLAFF